jgi:hypothetical protein
MGKTHEKYKIFKIEFVENHFYSPPFHIIPFFKKKFEIFVCVRCVSSSKFKKNFL